MSVSTNITRIDYDLPSAHAPTMQCSTQQAWAKVPSELESTQKQWYIEQIKMLLAQKNAVLVAHYYVNADIKELAIQTGGMVGDSLQMAQFAAEHPADTLIVAGVRFMGESAKILSPNKTVLMPDLQATCSLDLGCPVDVFTQFCDENPDREVVVYANTSAEVKARADWVVTSAIAVDLIAYLHAQGKKILWGPDRHLGGYLARLTGADMLLWQGSCLVHDEFKALELSQLQKEYSNAATLVHPEAPESVVLLADVVGSTSQLIDAAVCRDETTLIVATDLGILHEMQKLAPCKTFIAAPTAGESATCKSCAFCPWMAMNELQGIYDVLKNGKGEIILDDQLVRKAKQPLDRMLSFAKTLKNTTSIHGLGQV